MPIFNLTKKLHSEERGAEVIEWVGTLAVLLLLLIAFSTVVDGRGAATGQSIIDQVGCKVSNWTGGGGCGSAVAVQASPAAGNSGNPVIAVEETADSNNPTTTQPSGQPQNTSTPGLLSSALGSVLDFLIPPAAAADVPPTQPATSPDDLLTHDEALQLLNNAGITEIVSSGNCTDASQSNCTSLDNVRRESIEGLIDFKEKCDAVMGDCDIYITGGTETGHSNGTHSHSNGHKIDFRWTFNGSTDNFAGQYIRANFIQGTSWVSASNVTYTPYTDPSTGYRYLFEDYRNHTDPNKRGNSHWDIRFCNGC